MSSVLGFQRIRNTGYGFCRNLDILNLDAACAIMWRIGHEVDTARAL